MTAMTGVVAEWCEREYGGRFESLDLSSVVGTANGVVAQNDGERVSLLFINLSVNTIYLRMAGPASATVGIPLAPSGGSLATNMLEDLNLPSMQWQAMASGANSYLAVYGVRRYLRTDTGDK